MTTLAVSTPVADDNKSLHMSDSDQANVPSVPLDDVEHKPRGKTMQLLSVLISGVALFSDGYNIQVTGMCRTLVVHR
jgi:hypothetical protein